MLRFYFSSVIVWTLILWALSHIAVDSSRKNGWFKQNETPKLGLRASLVLALVPVIRSFIVFTLCITMFVKKDKNPVEETSHE